MSGQSSSQDRSEKATPQRRRRARREGQVARSRELSAAALLLSVGLLLYWWAPRFGQFCVELMRRQLSQSGVDASPTLQLGDALLQLTALLLPLFGILALLILLVGTVPGGFVLVGSALQPKFSRMNPLSGLGRMFSRQGLVELVKSLLKVALLGGVLALLLQRHWPVLRALNRLPVGEGLHLAMQLVAQTLIAFGGVLLFIAVIDVPFQYWSLQRKLRMTKQEIREEHKSSEGRPEIKQRIRQVQLMFARARMQQRVPEADVILVNPTHYAVAIKYDVDRANAPFVIAKGADLMAARIREVADAYSRTILEVPELTRALYYSTRVDQEIPAGLYTAVAYVLTYVMQLQAYRRGRGAQPQPLRSMPIPEALRR